MIDMVSDERAIFITGTRGSGKTVLLEQLSMITVQNRPLLYTSKRAVHSDEYYFALENDWRDMVWQEQFRLVHRITKRL